MGFRYVETKNDQPVIHRGMDDKLHDLFRA